MASPKKTPEQSKATKKNRIGKNKRAEIVDWYRPIFKRTLSSHLEANKPTTSRPGMVFLSRGIPSNLPVPPREYESCPVCHNLPYAPNIIVRPHLTLTEEDAQKYLLELGFTNIFIDNYIKTLKVGKTLLKPQRVVWGVPDVNGLLRKCIEMIIRNFPWITDATLEIILYCMFKENYYTPGKGTIKTKIKILRPNVEKRLAKSTRFISEYNDTKETIKEGILKRRDNRIADIHRASEKAIKEVEKGIEEELEMLEAYYPNN